MVEHKLYEQGLTLDTVFSQAPIGIAINEPSDDAGNGMVAINPMYEQITGRSKEELLKLGWGRITHPDDLDEDLQNLQKLQAGEIKSYIMEKRFIKPDGSIVWVHMVVAPLTLSNQSKFNHICLVQDISERKRMENDLRYNNEHDLWTGLYNRSYLETLLKKEARLQDAKKSALVGINLGAVHLLSITYGFQYSQELIKKAAVALQSHCHENCALFKMYENHFAFYIKAYQEKNELTAFCQALGGTLEALLIVERIGAGIGIIEIDDNNKHDVGVLLKNLLIASEKAINVFDSDIGCCFFDEEMEKQIIRAEEIKRELAQIAADGDSDRLFLQFQPILDLQTNRICGFEALARVIIDKLGLIMPLEFIPMAEETKLINPLGERIILQALHFLQTLQAKGYHDVCVSINISAIQLLRNDFIQKLMEMIDEIEVHPGNIGLEITESVFSSNYQELNRTLGELKDLGIQVAIDDFGTGYSSLARERELNVSCLKIDKFFIDKLLMLKDEQTITGDIIAMAHKLGQCVIAEGIEDEKQLQYLKRYGCDRIQGFLISEPLDEAAALELLQQQTGIMKG